MSEQLRGVGSVLAQGHPALVSNGPPVTGVEWVSLRQGSDWWATDLREESGRFRFRIFHRGRYVIEVRLAAFGLRNVVAALSAVAASAGWAFPWRQSGTAWRLTRDLLATSSHSEAIVA